MAATSCCVCVCVCVCVCMCVRVCVIAASVTCDLRVSVRKEHGVSGGRVGERRECGGGGGGGRCGRGFGDNGGCKWLQVDGEAEGDRLEVVHGQSVTF